MRKAKRIYSGGILWIRGIHFRDIEPQDIDTKQKSSGVAHTHQIFSVLLGNKQMFIFSLYNGKLNLIIPM